MQSMTKPKHTKNGKKIGRPTDYDPSVHLPLIESCPPPVTILQLCEVMAVPRSTMYLWMKEHEPFMDAVMRARRAADDMVVNAWHRKALGYDTQVKEDKPIKEADGSQTMQPAYRDVHVPPDAAAAMSWLKNRDPENWADSRKLEVHGDHVDMVQRALKELGMNDD